MGHHTCSLDIAHVVESVDTAVAAATLITGRLFKYSLKGKPLLFASHPYRENPRAYINSSCKKKSNIFSRVLRVCFATNLDVLTLMITSPEKQQRRMRLG